MVERLNERPRVHSCLFNWCPEQREHCTVCDAVCRTDMAFEAERKATALSPPDGGRAT